MRVMAAERYNDPFSLSDFGLGYSHWDSARDELWAPLSIAAQEWFARCRSLNKQWLDFVQRRVDQDWKLAEHLAACRTPGEVWSLYSEFLRKATTDYQEELSFLRVAGSEFLSQHAEKSSGSRKPTLQ
jgi:hypothetical protein